MPYKNKEEGYFNHLAYYYEHRVLLSPQVRREIYVRNLGNGNKGMHQTEKQKAITRETGRANKGRKHPELSLALKGRHFSPRTEFTKGHNQGGNMIFSNPEERAEKLRRKAIEQWNRQGRMIDREEREARKDFRYSRWQKAVILRAYHTCYICGESSGRMIAHHLTSFKYDRKGRFDINNGRCLCVSCNRLIHKAINNKQMKSQR